MNPDISYIAGFFDGEGSIGLYRFHGDKFVLRTQLVQNSNSASRKLFSYLLSRFGGNCNRKKKRMNWQLNSRKAANFLTAILPHIRLKKKEAELAIKWVASRPSPSRNSRGQFNRYPHRKYDLTVAIRLKKLKRQK